MPTRLKRPSFWRHVFVAAGLVAFQGYLAFNVVSGQFGIESQKAMQTEIEELKAQSGALQAEIDAYRHRVTLFDPSRLDPDIVSERARALLAMAQPDDLLIMVDVQTGKPLTSSSLDSSENQLSEIIGSPTER